MRKPKEKPASARSLKPKRKPALGKQTIRDLDAKPTVVGKVKGGGYTANLTGSNYCN